MKNVITGIEKGDKLYIVYEDINKDYQIGEAMVTGFSNWEYNPSGIFEDCKPRPMRNINYEFEGIQFSRDLENIGDKTYFRDSPMYGSKYSHIFSDCFVIAFTTYDEAKDCIVSMLQEYINSNAKEIEKLKQEIKKYSENREKFLNNVKSFGS